MMEDLLYQDTRLVALYDVLNAWDKDSDFYFGLANQHPAKILDAGCGTGLLATAYAGAGHDVVGIDPSAEMLSIARNRPNGQYVKWQQSTLQTFITHETFDFVVMTGHAFQCLITDEAIKAAFCSVAACLKPHGTFVFETRNPKIHGWKRWTPEHSKSQKTAPDGQCFEFFHEVLEVNDETVLFETTYNLEAQSTPLQSRSVLRFASVEKITSLTEQAGLKVDAVFGDWDRSVFYDHSPEIIMTLRLQ
ncbi:MAG: class I SAM-dependent methyltransferase [Pseudomonadota bacterium]